MKKRTKNDYQTFIHGFVKNVSVVCPVCASEAFVKAESFSCKDDDKTSVTCVKCGYNKKLSEKPLSILYVSNRKIITGRIFSTGSCRDPYFGLPLWLQTRVGQNLLWAYNREHLDFLRQHVEAELRERNGQEYFNKSLGSRLPGWISAKENREKILKAIEKLNFK